MIGSGRQSLEAAVSRPHHEESDPLLAFSIESGAASPPAQPPGPTAQPVAPPVDPQPAAPSAASSESLAARIEGLARALNDSRAQVSSLKSEVATLVRAVEDIRKQSSRTAMPIKPRAQGSARAWIASAIVAAILGAGAAFAGWTYLEGDADASLVALAAPVTHEVEPVPTPAASPSIVNVALIESDSKVPDAPSPKTLVSKAPAPKSAEASQALKAPQAPRYVGTLSIDAVPGGDVFLDREPAGRTPRRLTNLRAGSHLVWIEREGYRRFTRVVQVPADQVTRLSAVLEPIAAR